VHADQIHDQRVAFEALRGEEEQDGQHLTRSPYKIIGGTIHIPDAPGFGLEIDMDAILKANALYKKLPYGDRRDDVGMQHLIPGWKFDSKKPCMVR